MRFFTPNEKFFAWLQGILAEGPKCIVIDCGCGDGDLVLEMRHRGIPAIGVDPMFDPLRCVGQGSHDAMTLSGAVLAMPAEDCTLVRNTKAILLTCRPCHSGFPGRVAEVRHSESRLFYVGFGKNRPTDLGGRRSKLAMRAVVGEEGEKIWEVS